VVEGDNLAKKLGYAQILKGKLRKESELFTAVGKGPPLGLKKGGGTRASFIRGSQLVKKRSLGLGQG